MRLRSLELSDFRKFDRPVRLEGLGDGINVLAEPNEFGKSTLLAAIKAVLFERHRAKGKVGERMQHHRNATSPLLRMGFELADGLHHIEKRFMHKEPYARLTLPDGSRFEGDAAEERLQSLLGFEPAGKQGATPDSIGLWGALWVEQQAAIRQPALPEAGRATLHACLEAELGTLAGGDRSGTLSRQVKAELSELIDGNGRPKNRLKEAVEQLAATEAELLQHRGKLAALEDAIGTLLQRRRELAQVDDGEADAQLAKDLLDARTRRDAAMRHMDVLRQAVTALHLADRNHQDASEETGRRADRRSRIARAEQVLAAARVTEQRKAEDQAAAEMAVTEKRRGVHAAEVAAAAAAQALRAANAGVSLAMRSEQVVRLGDQLARAAAAQSEVSRLLGELSAQPADAARLQAVTSAAGALDRARSVLDALATEVEFDLVPAAAGRVEVSGTALPSGRTVLRVVEDTAIEIAGIGRVRVRPAIRDRGTLQANVAEAQNALRTALLAIGAADPAEAAAKAAIRRELVERLKAAEAALKAETPGEAAITLAPGLEALRNHVDAGRSRLQAELASLGLTALPTVAEADAKLRTASKEDEAATEILAIARTGLAGPEAEHARAITARSASVIEAGDAQGTLDQLNREEAAAIATATDAVLADRLRETDTVLGAQRALVAQMQRDQPADTVEGMDARIKRLDQAGTSRHDRVRRLREEIAGLAARIAHDEGEGLEEQIATVERRWDDLLGEQGALQREVAVLTLLRDTLAGAEREARERYVAPVLRRVTPYLQGLFPGVEVGLGDDLQVTKLTRQFGPEDLDRLSDGTVEQIAVLLRLAYADLLLERGKPAMLILDDALAYSDRDRLELIFDVLTRAAERMQVLVLTCRIDAFSRLGGNRVELVPQ